MTQSVDATYLALGARYLRRQVRQLADQLDGVRHGEDAECVHRARVASRRLRAALRMFHDGWRRKTIKRWRKQIRRITESLGAARDQDVQIDFLCGILRTITDPACAAGIVRLLTEAQRQRDLLDPAVLDAIGRIETSRVLDEILSATKKVLARAKAAPGEHSPAACAETGQFVLRRLGELLARQASLDDANDCESHHAMRIAVKRLRYTLEVARPVCPGRLDEFLEAAKKLQTLLGDVHDCDVWQQHLDKFAELELARLSLRFRSQGRFFRLAPGIEYVKHERAGHRAAVFQELLDYWRELERQEFWQRLQRVVEQHGAGVPAAEPPAAGAAPTEVPAVPSASNGGERLVPRSKALLSSPPRKAVAGRN
jgi:CHAD domain-containing protein